MEADPRHAELICEQLGVDDARALISPGVGGDNEDDLEVTTPSFSISPNPASNTLRLNGSYANCGVRVHETSGKLVVDYNRIPSLNGLNIDIQGLVEGIYLVNLYDPLNESVLATEMLVVNR